jgi:hypothetical protein
LYARIQEKVIPLVSCTLRTELTEEVTFYNDIGALARLESTLALKYPGFLPLRGQRSDELVIAVFSSRRHAARPRRVRHAMRRTMNALITM